MIPSACSAADYGPGIGRRPSGSRRSTAVPAGTPASTPRRSARCPDRTAKSGEFLLAVDGQRRSSADLPKVYRPRSVRGPPASGSSLSRSTTADSGGARTVVVEPVEEERPAHYATLPRGSRTAPKVPSGPRATWPYVHYVPNTARAGRPVFGLRQLFLPEGRQGGDHRRPSDSMAAGRQPANGRLPHQPASPGHRSSAAGRPATASDLRTPKTRGDPRRSQVMIIDEDGWIGRRPPRLGSVPQVRPGWQACGQACTWWRTGRHPRGSRR